MRTERAMSCSYNMFMASALPVSVTRCISSPLCNDCGGSFTTFAIYGTMVCGMLHGQRNDDSRVERFDA